MGSNWRFSTEVSFDLLDFHDSPVTYISFQSGAIELYLDYANVLSSHSANPSGRAKCTGNAILRFEGVHSSDPVLFRDKEAEQHPEPSFPIRGEICQTSVVCNGHHQTFFLAGNHADADGRTIGWVEWRISAERFVFMWDDFSGDAWFESNGST